MDLLRKGSISLRKRIFFELLRNAKRSGAQFARLTEIDGFVKNGRAGFFIKHDIHGLFLESLIEFAAKEKSMDILGTYFFMAPNHPLTSKHYSFMEQVTAMKEIEELGHDIGLHLDPFFLIHYSKKPLRDIMSGIIGRFNDEGVTFCCGNMHGNSAFKGLDKNGFGTSFDLFEEIGRQPDFPTLSDVPPEVAAILRSNRISLSDYGFTHWGDIPFWSKINKFIVTNFISDNPLGKKGHLGVTVHEETVGSYKLSDRQSPGSRTSSVTRSFVRVELMPECCELDTGSRAVDFYSEEAISLFKALSCRPVQFLIHPQNYCV